MSPSFMLTLYLRKLNRLIGEERREACKNVVSSLNVTPEELSGFADIFKELNRAAISIKEKKGR